MIDTLGISTGGTGVTVSTGTSTAVFFYKKLIDPMAFNSMMQEEDIKNRFKEELVYELAKQLIASNRTTFTYSRDHFIDQYILKAEIKL
jgi:hypothetical protein